MAAKQNHFGFDEQTRIDTEKSRARKNKIETISFVLPFNRWFFLIFSSLPSCFTHSQCDAFRERSMEDPWRGDGSSLMHFVFMNGIIRSSKEIRHHFFFSCCLIRFLLLSLDGWLTLAERKNDILFSMNSHTGEAETKTRRQSLRIRCVLPFFEQLFSFNSLFYWLVWLWMVIVLRQRLTAWR